MTQTAGIIVNKVATNGTGGLPVVISIPESLRTNKLISCMGMKSKAHNNNKNQVSFLGMPWINMPRPTIITGMTINIR
jgi:hypothetical protein